ncbi:hypothetical protein TNCV_637431 [Trichonephila clavipes]|nr:hypothetical protein TNCV_637431 [Trichonephila clavipes]
MQQSVLDTVGLNPSNMLGVGVTRATPSLCQLPRNDPYSHKRYMETAEACARFRPTTGGNILEVYLHWLGLATDEACLLYGYAGIDGEYMLQCTGLDEYPTNDIFSRYGEAWLKMVKK